MRAFSGLSGLLSSHRRVLRLHGIERVSHTEQLQCKAAAAAPALERHVSHWKNAVWVEHDDLVKVRLLAQGAGEVLPCLWVHLHSHVVAVVRVHAAGGAEATGGTTDFAAGR